MNFHTFTGPVVAAALLMAGPASANQWLLWDSKADNRDYVQYVRNTGPRVVEIKQSWRSNFSLMRGMTREDVEGRTTVDCKRKMFTGAEHHGATFQYWDITPSGSWYTSSHYPDRERMRASSPRQWRLLSFVCNQWGGGLS